MNPEPCDGMTPGTPFPPKAMAQDAGSKPMPGS